MKKKKSKKLFVVLVSLGLAFFLWGKDFFRISTKATGPPGYYQGGIWADLNGDHLVDVFLLANRGSVSLPNNAMPVNENNQLFYQQEDGSFRKIHDDPVVNIKGNFTSATVGDYNNDGHIDIFITNGESPSNDLDRRNLLFANNGDGSFSRIVDQELVNENFYSVDCSWGDYDDDGFLDLYVCNRDERNSLFHNQGDGTFVKMNTILPAEAVNGYGCSWADFNDDGLLDLFVAQAGNQSCVLYQNEGEGVFVDVTPAEMAADIFLNTRETILSLWVDFDNDGLLDLTIFPGNTEPPRRYKNLKNGNFTRILDGPFQLGSPSGHAAAPGDYDNDGDLDLFIAGKENNSINLFYANNGSGTFSPLQDGMMISDTTNTTMACKWWDINMDGFLDLYLTRRIDENRIYQNRRQGNNWLVVQCVGSRSNRAAIGALVQVSHRAGDSLVKQTRLVTAQPYGEQTLHFGLGQSTSVETVSIRWPSGLWQHLADVDANQNLTVIEEPAAEVFPPNNFKVTRLENSLLFFKEYINRLEWQANPDNITAVDYYRLYRKVKNTADNEYELVTKVDGEIFFYEETMLAPNQFFTYKITAVNQDGRISKPVFTSN